MQPVPSYDSTAGYDMDEVPIRETRRRKISPAGGNHLPALSPTEQYGPPIRFFAKSK